MSCGCHREHGCHRDSDHRDHGCHKECGRPCSCNRRTHHAPCACPERERRCVRVETIFSQEIRQHRKQRCRRVREAAELPVGRISVDCTPVHFESARGMGTVVACCVNGIRQPTDLMPFDPSPFIQPVPSKFTPTEIFSTMNEQINTLI